jgi:hypothetical protein
VNFLDGRPTSRSLLVMRDAASDPKVSEEQLSQLASAPWLHRQLLGDYSGPYSLGVGLDETGHSVFLLRVDSTELTVPATVVVQGIPVPVVVRRQFKAPVPTLVGR